MKNTSPLVITISRQLGSGGGYVGQHLAKNLNLLYLDREILSQAAKKLSVLEEDLETYEEKSPSFWQSLFQASRAGNPENYLALPVYLPTDQELFRTETEVIERITKECSAVVVGRCGSHILGNRPNHVSVLLHAEMAFRKERVQKIYSVSKEEAENMIMHSDKERARYYKRFTGSEWMDARQFDLSVNTGKIGLDTSVELIQKYLQLI